jgi:hypothetical protein
VTSCLTGAVHSGQEGVGPEVWRALPFIRRCHGAPLSIRGRTAVLPGMPGPHAGSSRLKACLSSQRDRQALASRVSSDALAAGRDRRGHTRNAAVLEVRRTFVTSRLSAAYLAAAYAQVAPTHRRPTRMTEGAKVPIAEVTWRRAAGEGRRIRDV